MSSLEILIVEDDKDFADSLAEVLDEHQVTVLASGEEAVANYDEKAFDLVLLDIKLPGMSGLECLRAIRTINPIANVVIMTGANTVQNRQEAKDNGAITPASATGPRAGTRSAAWWPRSNGIRENFAHG